MSRNGHGPPISLGSATPLSALRPGPGSLESRRECTSRRLWDCSRTPSSATHREHRGEGMRAARVCSDILGTIPIRVVDVDVRVVRPGRTVELIEPQPWRTRGGRWAGVDDGDTRHVCAARHRACRDGALRRLSGGSRPRSGTAPSSEASTSSVRRRARAAPRPGCGPSFRCWSPSRSVPPPWPRRAQRRERHRRPRAAHGGHVCEPRAHRASGERTSRRLDRTGHSRRLRTRRCGSDALDHRRPDGPDPRALAHFHGTSALNPLVHQ